MESSPVTDDESNFEGREDAAESRPTVTLPKYKRGDEVVEWMEVDKEWWEYAQKAREVNERVVEMLRDDPGVNYIETSQGEEKTEAGWTKSCITVLVDDDETADRLSLPDEIDGVPINVKVGDGRAVE